MTGLHPNYKQALDALRANPEPALRHIAAEWTALGAKAEWSRDDNYAAAEGLALLAAAYPVPVVSDQSDEDLKFWGLAAYSLGYPADYDLDAEDSGTYAEAGVAP